jgi:hypothetical protein
MTLDDASFTFLKMLDAPPLNALNMLLVTVPPAPAGPWEAWGVGEARWYGLPAAAAVAGLGAGGR